MATGQRSNQQYRTTATTLSGVLYEDSTSNEVFDLYNFVCVVIRRKKYISFSSFLLWQITFSIEEKIKSHRGDRLNVDLEISLRLPSTWKLSEID